MCFDKFDWVVLVLAIGLVGCGGAKEEQVIGKPPTEETVQGNFQRTDRIQLEKTPEVRAKTEPEPVFVADGWPFNDDGRLFRVTWGGGNEEVPLFANPSLNAEILSKGKFTKGREIIWTQSVVAVFRPSTYRVKTEVTVEGYVADNGYRTGGDAFSETLSPGEVVSLYTYAGSSLCNLGVRQTIVQAFCPTAEHYRGSFKGRFTAEKYQPAERIWWLYVNSDSGSGWLALDDRVLVDIE